MADERAKIFARQQKFCQTFVQYVSTKVRQKSKESDEKTYLIPIRIYTPLIFAHLACANIKGGKFAKYDSAKIKGRRKNATNGCKDGKL